MEDSILDLKPTGATNPAASAGGKAFANFDVVVKSWYVAARSEQVGRGQVKSVELFKRRVVLWRGEDGVVHVFDGRCPHLGANLGNGRVVDDRLRCAFHHWTFDGGGECFEAPACATVPRRSARVFPVVERFGLIWVFNGAKATFDPPALPDGDDENLFRTLRPPSQHIRCHPHLVIANGLDVSHFETLHGMRYTAPPEFRQIGDLRLTVSLRGVPRSRTVRLLAGVRGEVEAIFTTVGPNVAWLTVSSRVRLHVLFAVRPSPRRGTETQTVLFLPRGGGLATLRTLVLVYVLMRDDRKILEGLEFHAGFTEADEPLRRFAELVNGLETDTETDTA